MVSNRLFTSQLHPTPVWSDIYEGENLGAINRSALSVATSPAETLYLVRPVHSRSRSEEVNVECFVSKIRSACFLFSRCVPQTVVDSVEMSLRWLCESIGQERELQGRHADPTLEVGEITKIKDENEEATVYGDAQPIK